jgi:hypothetical protein
MNDEKMKLKQIAEEKRRRAAITRDKSTIPMDFGVGMQEHSEALDPRPSTLDPDPRPFDIVTNPGIYAEDPVWKRFWKVEGIRAVNPDGSIITDAMERFRQAFGFGASYMEAEQENRLAILREQIISLQVDLAEQNDENELLAITNRHLAAELAAVKKSLKNYTAAIEAL